MRRIIFVSFSLFLALGGFMMISHGQPNNEQKKNAPNTNPPIVADKKGDGAKPVWARPLHVRQSKPVTVNDAEFVAFTEAEWEIPAEKSKRASIEIQLRITNVRKTEATFLTFDAFGITIKDASGKEVKHNGGRDITNITRSILLDARGSYSICRRAEWRRNEGAKSGTLNYFDGSGSVQSFDSLSAGKYTLSFWYATDSDHEIHNALMNGKKLPGAPLYWSGRAKTGEVPFEILDTN